jgi:uncharacterized protein YacL
MILHVLVKGLRLAALYSSYNAIGFYLLFWSHGEWFITAKELGMPQVAHAELTTMKILQLGIPYIILAFISTFILIYVSEYLELHRIKTTSKTVLKILRTDIAFPIILFFVSLVISMLGCYVIPLALNYVTIIGSFTFSGIIGISYFFHINFTRARRRF